ncbi:flagellar motor protein MotB [Fuscovulum ytuae]|uniref:Flagellar motor protein MotB n=1 Tax=Fuscovulum ytuae TaxID=3042299 RepID=A0ABY8Q325_9RHOB|nr:flagellar motor protein MotB [Fuscovulum sp. YMD61]WGV15248.1 flagellar motor protein MotB [Fuscovulum sp. YMD61]
MTGQRNAAPIVVKRKKVVAGGGHHGGAWKVAYADFVTAMMAFFLLMWLLNATTEQQRDGIADYFNPTVPINRVAGGGDGPFGGESILSEPTLALNGSGASANNPIQTARPRSDGGPLSPDDAAEEATLREAEKRLLSYSGESAVSDLLRQHVITRLSDEGLVIELFDTAEGRLFREETAEPSPLLRDLMAVVAEVAALATNRIAVNGHVRAYPAPLRRDPAWDLSTARAEQARALLAETTLDPARLHRVTGYADRRPASTDPTAARNNRIEVVLLRRASALSGI